MFNVFSIKFNTKIVERSKTKLLHKIKAWKNKNIGEAEELHDKGALHNHEETAAHKKWQKTIRSSSPWLGYFQNMMQEIENKNQNLQSPHLKLNSFYSQTLSNYLLRHWLSLFPL